MPAGMHINDKSSAAVVLTEISLAPHNGVPLPHQPGPDRSQRFVCCATLGNCGLSGSQYRQDEPMVFPTFSMHAATRAQQRGIPQWVAQLLLAEGERAPAGGGLIKVYFGSRARKRICRRARCGEFPIGKLDHVWGAYLVMTRAEPHVVTVGHTGGRRIHRP